MFQAVKEFLRFRAAKQFYVRYERQLVPLMLVIGVVIDVATFRSIDLTTAFALLGVYTVLAGVMILFMHHHDARHGIFERPSSTNYLRIVAPLIVQFTLGALLSAALVFYWFSGNFIVSWPLFVLLIALMAGNDVFREHYLRPTVQIAVFYFVLFSTLATALPSLVGSISPTIFVVAGVVSLALMAGYHIALFRVRPDLRLMRPSPWISMCGIFLVMNAAYFLNIIPPIPLSLTQSGVYYSIERRGSEYALEAPEQSWLESFLPGQTIELKPGQRVYAFASIFAPVDLNTTVIHDWQRLTDDGWVSVNRLFYSIVGGRHDGYRGYSYITNHTEGKWRVNVETLRGQVIGRISFTIERQN